MQDLPNGGAHPEGGGCKHWPPGAGDPRYATDVYHIVNFECFMIMLGLSGVNVSATARVITRR